MQFERYEDAAHAAKLIQSLREDLKVKQLGPDDSGQYNTRVMKVEPYVTVKFLLFIMANNYWYTSLL